MDVTFHNPDGSVALIAYNDTGTVQTLTINSNNNLVDYLLAAGSMVTLKWQASPGVGLSSSNFYSVKNVSSNLCVEALADGITSGTVLTQNTCTAGASNQAWQLCPRTVATFAS